jgi:hypothetical protein
VLKKSRAIFYAARIFFVLASGDRTFENVAKLSPVAWSKKNLSHSTSYFSFVARSWRTNMYEDVIGTDMMPTFLKIMGQMVQNWLIDCGESADRLGFKRFGHITFKFLTKGRQRRHKRSTSQ